MRRRDVLGTLAATVCGLLLVACESNEPAFGAPKFTVEVACKPAGAMLYVVEAREFDRLDGALDALDLDDHRVGRCEEGETLSTTVRAYGQVLVGDWEGARATLRFTPSADGQTFTVHAP